MAPALMPIVKFVFGPAGKIVAVLALTAGVYVVGHNNGANSVETEGYRNQIAALQLQIEEQKEASDRHLERLAEDQRTIRSLEDSLEDLENDANDTDVCIATDNTDRLRSIFDTYNLTNSPDVPDTIGPR